MDCMRVKGWAGATQSQGEGESKKDSKDHPGLPCEKNGQRKGEKVKLERKANGGGKLYIHTFLLHSEQHDVTPDPSRG